ncbi:MAG: FMN-binding protein [Candidatus Aerophobetes bacterium]|nr:FMN-binding protein [Candidatus Aerophobetes bacterium]
MRKVSQMILVLCLVGAVSGGALVGIYKYSQPLIKANKKREIREAIFTVLPEVKNYEVIIKRGREIYKGFDASGNLTGYAFIGKGGGYQGEIEVMIGMDPQFTETKGIEILESVETPGLGAKIASDWFKNQFKKLNILPFIELIKGKRPEEPNQIQAITGATISSQTVVNILNKTIKEIGEELGKRAKG